jgi:predicted nucleic acid-binding protein
VITAIDTSVLIAIDLGEPGAGNWVDLLARCRSEGALCVCDVVAAEFFAVVMDRQQFVATLRDLGIHLQAVSLEAACRAGETFRNYREQGGPRKHLIPDFLIAAHAEVDADRLISADRGYLRRYFPKLQLLEA